jgi:hypothetical protein
MHQDIPLRPAGFAQWRGSTDYVSAQNHLPSSISTPDHFRGSQPTNPKSSSLTASPLTLIRRASTLLAHTVPFILGDSISYMHVTPPSKQTGNHIVILQAFREMESGRSPLLIKALCLCIVQPLQGASSPITMFCLHSLSAGGPVSPLRL